MTGHLEMSLSRQSTALVLTTENKKQNNTCAWNREKQTNTKRTCPG